VRRELNLLKEERDRIIRMLASSYTVVKVAKAYSRSDRCI
jgi:hypothetical protein